MKLDAKEIAKPALILFLICLIITACLAGTNLLTKKVIAKEEEKSTQQSRLLVLPTADTFEKSDRSDICYVGKKSDSVVGYVFTTTAASYGGTIEVMTGIDSDGKISGVTILSISDTPGLGMNAKKESFLGQYRKGIPENGFEVVKGGNASDGQINAITGATITSKAVTSAVNDAVTEYNKIKGGE